MKFIDEIIRSRNNPTVKLAATLKDKKGRDNEKCFIAEGEKLTYEALSSGMPVVKIFVSEEKSEKIIPKLKELNNRGFGKNASVFILSAEAFSKISTENAPQGVISVIKHLDFFRRSAIIYKEEFSQNACGRSIVLSSIRDPGNLGSTIRSAVAFGVEHIILSSDCADIYNPKTVRGAMGSLYRVNVTIVENLSDYISAMHQNGRRVFSAELSLENMVVFFKKLCYNGAIRKKQGVFIPFWRLHLWLLHRISAPHLTVLTGKMWYITLNISIPSIPPPSIS
jgi:TrmH family RNA methyltransferase